MALNIRNVETERLAKLTGENKAEAVTKALGDRLAKVTSDRHGRRLADELDEISTQCARRIVRDSRTADEILGYDDSELPG